MSLTVYVLSIYISKQNSKESGEREREREREGERERERFFYNVKYKSLGRSKKHLAKIYPAH
jgi:hypothetical protein